SPRASSCPRCHVVQGVCQGVVRDLSHICSGSCETMLPSVAEVRTPGWPGTDPPGTPPALPCVTSCQLLRQEHNLIWQVVGAVEMLAAGMQGCRGIPTPFSGAIDFFASFVDGCHEVKEEEGLLPVLAGYGVPAEDSFTGLLAEHAEGRRL